MDGYGAARRRAAGPRMRLWAALVVVVAATLGPVLAAEAAADLTVGEALGAQDGRSASVAGFVVGQPMATDTVLRSGFTGDTALALADSAGETDTDRMLYVQVTSGYRAGFGLRTRSNGAATT